MNPYIYLLNGLPVNQPSGGSWVVASLTVTGNESVGGNLSVTGTGTFGVAQIGTGIAGFAEVSAAAFFNTTDYCLIQNGSGKTQINAALGQSTEIRSNRNVLAATFTNGNTTLAGNLTVSGTSGANVLYGQSNQQLFLDSVAGAAYTSLYWKNGGNQKAGIYWDNGGNAWWFDSQNASSQMWLNAASAVNLSINSVIGIKLASSGNSLFGATVDGGNGRIQLLTHTTSAGGIGFGTETALYRQAAGALSIDHIGGSVPVLNLSENGTIKAILQTSSGNVYLGAINTAGASLFLRSGNNTTALTLDSSQNATFTGTIKSTYGSYAAQAYTIGDSSYGLLVESGNLRFKNSNSGTFEFRTIAGTGTTLFIAPTIVALNSGTALKLGNAYTAGVVAQTGYVTIQDSNGNTYKVLCAP